MIRVSLPNGSGWLEDYGSGSDVVLVKAVDQSNILAFNPVRWWVEPDDEILPCRGLVGFGALCQTLRAALGAGVTAYS